MSATQIPYTHDRNKLADAGLMLNLPPDLVPKTAYSYFTNAISRIEGQVQTREGMAIVCSLGSTPVHTIFRLNQYVPGTLGERLFGIGSSLYSAPLPAGNVPALLTNPGAAYDGLPLSIVAFRFDADPNVWAIIANGNAMTKRRAMYYQNLGIAPPTVGAVASAGGTGNLNSTGGVGYDWRYTYYNPVVQSESNSSRTTGTPLLPAEVLRPTAYTNPAFGGSVGFSNPGNAIDGSGSTFADGLAQSGGNASASCEWNTWGTSSAPYVSLNLVVKSFGAQTGPYSLESFFAVQYSLDDGMTWNTVFLFRGTGSRDAATTPDVIALPPSTDISLLRVRSYCNQDQGTPGQSEIGVYDIRTEGEFTVGGGSLILTNQSAIVCVVPPTDPQATQIRLYRRGGSLVSNWYLTSTSNVTDLVQGVCGAGTLEIVDNNSDASIENNNTLQLDNDQPISSVQNTAVPLPVIWGYEGRILGCGDPGRPDAVYFSKIGNADEWPPENWITTAESGGEMMNGLVYDLRCFTFSRERCIQLLPNIIGGITFTPAETSCRRGLKGRWALCSGERGIYFISKDGAYRTVGGPEESIVDSTIRPLFPTFDGAVGQDVNGYEAIDMTDENGLRLSYNNGEVWFDYTGVTSQMRRRLVYDERRSRWRSAVYTPLMQMAYSEPGTTSSFLMGAVNGNVYKSGGLDDNGAAIHVQVRTGSYDQSTPLNLKEYASVALDLDPGGATVPSPVVVTPYANADTIAEAVTNIDGTLRQRVPVDLGDTYALNLSLDFAWDAGATIQPVLYQTDMLYRREPSGLRHWELPLNSLGTEGWMHVRDCYLTLRSAANVVVTLNLDNGASQSFTVPTTSGNKHKVYIPFAANKCKLAGLTVTSTSDFRIYESETEWRAKQWLTRLGYRAIPIIGAEEIES